MTTMNVTVELCQEDRERLDAIIKILTNAARCDKCVESVLEYTRGKQAPVLVKGNSENDAPAEQPTAQPAAEQQHTKDELRKLAVELAAGPNKAKMREILTRYADSITDLPDDAVDEVFAQFEALKEA